MSITSDAYLALAAKARGGLKGAKVSAAGFAASLRERFGLKELDDLNVPDLFLAWAALEQDAAALTELDRRLRACAVRLTTDAVDDVLQTARQRLLVGDGKKPRLLGYSGQGALVKWLKTVLLTISIDSSRKSKPERNDGDEQLALKASGEVGADVRLMNAHHRAEFNAAFSAALSELTAQERTILRMRFVDQMDIGDIARTFNVHRTTAMRWMEAAFQKVLGDTRATLAQKLKLRTADLDSLLRAFKPSLAERLSRLLPASK